MGPHDFCCIWIHRIGPALGSDAVSISRYFTVGTGRRYTDGRVPYHYVGTEQRVEQALALNQLSAHGRRWGGVPGIGFGQVGDFGRSAPTADQWRRAVDVCADLLPGLVPRPEYLLVMLPRWLRDGLPIYGHGEVPGTYRPGARKDQPGGEHACPGRYWPMDEFRSSVALELRHRAAIHLMEKGHRLLVRSQ